MNKKISSLIISVISSICIFFSNSNANASSINKNSEYVLIKYQERLAVFNVENLDNPYLILDVDFNSLTDYDKFELEKGILIENKENLNKIIEDFIG